MLFQFQYGAIGSLLPFQPAGQFRVSIPVWCDWEERGNWMNFGSRLVSIPVWCDWETFYIHFRDFLICFNSSMVRLGEDATQEVRKVMQFQFQYGAIGSTENAVVSN